MDNIAGASKAAEEGIVKIEKVAEQQIEALKEFPFNGLQALNSAIAKLREAKLVMELNRLVLQDVREHYQSVFDSREISPDVKQSCGLAHLSFQQRIKYLEKLLVMECLRVDTLTHMAGDGNSLVSDKMERTKKKKKHSPWACWLTLIFSMARYFRSEAVRSASY
jgi:hypothetical protein